MKATTFLNFLGLFAAGAVATTAAVAAEAAIAAEAALEAECGPLGVMKVAISQIPQDADLDEIRRCANHPLGRAPGLTPDQTAATTDIYERDYENDSEGMDGVSLKPRACYTSATHGCSGGYCWKQCGLFNDGKWCWTANLAGLGGWITCTSSEQCSQAQVCGIGVCKTCGCSC